MHALRSPLGEGDTTGHPAFGNPSCRNHARVFKWREMGERQSFQKEFNNNNNNDKNGVKISCHNLGLDPGGLG